MSLITSYDSRDALMQGLARTVAAQLRIALADKGSASLAVPGGTTPGPFLSALSQEELDWANVAVMLTDERFVPETSDRSNTRLLRETLLRNAAASATLVPLVAEAEQPEDVLDTLTDDLLVHLPLDVCVLGMGADMHTASLFPGADQLAEALSPGAAPLIAMRAPGAPEPRLTLSAPMLETSTHIHVLITGVEKRQALDTALAATSEEKAPIRIILRAPSTARVHYAD